MTSFGRFVEGDAIRFERLLAASPEEVWASLVESERLDQWLGDGEIEAKVGGKVALRSGGPVIRGIVRECEPPRLLSYSWNMLTLGEENPLAPESILRFALEKAEGGTRLTFVVGPVGEQYRARIAGGWHALLDILAAHVAGEPPPDFMDIYRAVGATYEKVVK